MKDQLTISSAYEWSKDRKPNSSEKAFKHLVKMIQSRFDGKTNKLNYKINYRRLRASAGKTMLESILKRIDDSEIIIFDISEKNPNVFLELGIALACSARNKYPLIYLIKKRNAESLLSQLPSDLQGYFVTEYIEDNSGKITFKDNGSLRMSIESDVKEYFNQINGFSQINEIEYDAD